MEYVIRIQLDYSAGTLYISHTVKALTRTAAISQALALTPEVEQRLAEPEASVSVQVVEERPLQQVHLLDT
jgi:hypothetical protein